MKFLTKSQAILAAALTATLAEPIFATNCRTDGGSASFKWDYSNPDYVLITTNNCPDHAFENSVGENPNSAIVHTMSFKLPKKPIFRNNNNHGYNTKVIQAMGPVGIALSGVAIFGPSTKNQPTGTGTYAGNTIDLFGDAGADPKQGGELDTFDYCGGHSTPDGFYHYHVDPYCIRKSGDTPGGSHSALLGFMSDGIPLYGFEGDKGNTPEDLDTCGGHSSDSGANGLYHYHMRTPSGPFPQETGLDAYDPTYFPYTPTCLMGCIYDETYNSQVLRLEPFNQCKQSGSQASSGFLQTYRYKPLDYDYSLQIPFDPVTEPEDSETSMRWLHSSTMVVYIAGVVGAIALIVGAALVVIRRRMPRPSEMDYQQLPNFTVQDK